MQCIAQVVSFPGLREPGNEAISREKYDQTVSKSAHACYLSWRAHKRLYIVHMHASYLGEHIRGCI